MLPTEPQRTRARTKIVATIGPASQSPEVVRELLERGVDVFRINMAHGDRAEHEQVLATLRAESERAGRPIGILIDLAGPKIRLGQLHTSPLAVEAGDEFTLVDAASQGQDAQGQGVEAEPKPGLLTSSYDSLIDELSVGDTLLLGDGSICMSVIELTPAAARLRVLGDGEIRSRQGINLPGVRLSVPTLTEQDVDNAVWAARQNVDFVSLSFVRSAVEIRQLKELLRQHESSALVVAKIEKREALQNLDEIVTATDCVMVARGDLGVEIDVAQTPAVQKRIIDACRRLWRPVIVATEMLDSMQRQRRPTRAEASDVANAILDGADACMLSGETAIGLYPRESVAMMNRIMLATEELLADRLTGHSPTQNADVHPVTSAVVQGGVAIANQLNARLMVIATRSGATARIHAKLRGRVPAVGVSNSSTTLRQMCLYWGIIPLPGAPVDDPPSLRKFIDCWGRADGTLSRGDRVVFLTGTGVIEGAHNLLVVHDVLAATGEESPDTARSVGE